MYLQREFSKKSTEKFKKQYYWTQSQSPAIFKISYNEKGVSLTGKLLFKILKKIYPQ